MPGPTLLTECSPLVLTTAGENRSLFDLAKNRSVFDQDDISDSIFYLRSGAVKVSVVSDQGTNAVVAILREGVFFGEDCLSRHGRRRASVRTLSPCSITMIESATFSRLLQDEAALTGVFIAHMIDRNLQLEEDRADQILNCSERRLARALVLLTKARDGHGPPPTLVKISQETLSEMVGTTRSRVSFFMNKFKRLGFISYEGGLQVHPALLSFLGSSPQQLAVPARVGGAPLALAARPADGALDMAAHRPIG